MMYEKRDGSMLMNKGVPSSFEDIMAGAGRRLVAG
jgi:hypothetical protein